MNGGTEQATDAAVPLEERRGTGSGRAGNRGGGRAWRRRARCRGNRSPDRRESCRSRPRPRTGRPTRPTPRPAPQGRRGQPEIEGADGDQGAAERYAVVDHEVEDAAAVQGAQVAGPHAEVTLVVRQESAGRPKRTARTVPTGSGRGRTTARSWTALNGRRLEAESVIDADGAHGRAFTRKGRPGVMGLRFIPLTGRPPDA